MSRMSATPTLARFFLPLYTARLTGSMQVLAVLLGTVLMTVSSWVVVPMIPIPMTLQTLAVTLIGAWYGWRLAGATLALWLLEAAAGMPVLAGGAGGLAYMAGPTGGYLAGFAVTAVIVGWLAERGVLGRSLGHAVGVMVIANALMVVIGAAWLTHFLGVGGAVAKGVLPFGLAGLVKACLAAGLVEAVGVGRRKSKRLSR